MKNTKIAMGMGVLVLSSVLSGCIKEEIKPQMVEWFQANYDSPSVWYTGNVKFYQSTASAMCAKEAVLLSVDGLMHKDKSSMYNGAEYEASFSTTDQKQVQVPCSSWNVIAELQRRAESIDENGNIIYKWVPVTNNSTVGAMDSECKLKISTDHDIEDPSTRIIVSVVGGPNGNSSNNLTGFVVQCQDVKNLD